MNIRMYELGHLPARRALAAGIAVVGIPAVEILDICQCERKGPATLVLIEKHGMRHPSAVRHGPQGV